MMILLKLVDASKQINECIEHKRVPVGRTKLGSTA